MGMPACRIGDLTEHGGTIMVGFPTVLIGDMPASRIGDMHVCPMVTPGLPPIPHVGGPFVLGSPTVIVGEMPQSRVTDMLVCVGPPDQAVLGCMTVLVGMAGGAGAAGAGAGAAAMGVPVPTPPPPGSSDDAAGATQAAQTKATRTPDGSIQTASTVPGKALPPIALKQFGWPDLPPENTATFSSVQPATVLPGTQLYAAGDGQDPGSNSYWSTNPPSNDPSQSDPGPGSDPDASPGLTQVPTKAQIQVQTRAKAAPRPPAPALTRQATPLLCSTLPPTSLSSQSPLRKASKPGPAPPPPTPPRACSSTLRRPPLRQPPPSSSTASRHALEPFKMDPAITQPYEHLVSMLAAFAATLRASQPPGPQGQRWSPALQHLDRELHHLRSLAAPAASLSALKNAATRLTQLARTQDGLRLEHSAAAPSEQLADQRRLVVLAAWQLQQALEHLSTTAAIQ